MRSRLAELTEPPRPFECNRKLSSASLLSSLSPAPRRIRKPSSAELAELAELAEPRAPWNALHNRKTSWSCSKQASDLPEEVQVRALQHRVGACLASAHAQLQRQQPAASLPAPSNYLHRFLSSHTRTRTHVHAHTHMM